MTILRVVLCLVFLFPVLSQESLGVRLSQNLSQCPTLNRVLTLCAVETETLSSYTDEKLLGFMCTQFCGQKFQENAQGLSQTGCLAAGNALSNPQCEIAEPANALVLELSASLDSCPEAASVLSQCGVSTGSFSSLTDAEFFAATCTASCGTVFQANFGALSSNEACSPSMALVMQILPNRCPAIAAAVAGEDSGIPYGQTVLPSLATCPAFANSLASCGFNTSAEAFSVLTFDQALALYCTGQCFAYLDAAMPAMTSNTGCADVVVGLNGLSEYCLGAAAQISYGRSLSVGLEICPSVTPAAVACGYNVTAEALAILTVSDGLFKACSPTCKAAMQNNLPNLLNKLGCVSTVASQPGLEGACNSAGFDLRFYASRAPPSDGGSLIADGVARVYTITSSTYTNFDYQHSGEFFAVKVQGDADVMFSPGTTAKKTRSNDGNVWLVATSPVGTKMVACWSPTGTSSTITVIAGKVVYDIRDVNTNVPFMTRITDPAAVYRLASISQTGGSSIDLMSASMEPLASGTASATLPSVTLDAPVFGVVTSTNGLTTITVSTNPPLLDFGLANSKALSPSYMLHWNVVGETLFIAIEAKTLGFVGFGLGEPTSGSMPGADIVAVGPPSENVLPVAVDYFATAKQRPNVDEQQDWKVQRFVQVGGQSFYLLSRALNTGDINDRPIVPGPTRIVFAHGLDTDLSLTYHFSRRGADVVEFIPSGYVVPTLPADTQELALLMNDFEIPGKETTYACMSFDLPQDRDYHIVKIAPSISQETMQMVHHFILYACTQPNSNYYNSYRRPGECSSPSFSSADCSTMVYAWAIGMGPFVYPADVGHRLGQTGFKYVIMEVHYDNPARDTGLLDNSGVVLSLTPTLRQYDADILALGDNFLRGLDIPAGSTCAHYEHTCPSQCTSQWLQDITVFASFPHMHQDGNQILTTVNRADEDPVTLARVDYWAVDFQSTIPLFDANSNGIVVKKGDRLNTHCVYGNAGTSPVKFGLGSRDEMCIHFLLYYPSLSTPSAPYPTCGSFRLDDNSPACSVCGDLLTTASNTGMPCTNVNVTNPSVEDPLSVLQRGFAPGSDARMCPLPPTPAPSAGPTPAPTFPETPAPTTWIESWYDLVNNDDADANDNSTHSAACAPAHAVHALAVLLLCVALGF